MRKIVIALVLLFPALLAAQTDNTFYAKAFRGQTVGQKVTEAQAACNSNTVIPCIIVIDPSLAAWPQGDLPTKCSQCSWQDYRVPIGSNGGSWGGITGLISAQTDLQTALAAKAAATAATTINGVTCALGSTCAVIGSIGNPRGAYVTATPYATNDLVSSGDSVWACITGCMNVVPVAGANWLLVGPVTGLTQAQISAQRVKLPLPLNLFNSATATTSWFINTSSCVGATNAAYYSSDAIPANSGGSMSFSGASASSVNGWSFKDAAGTCIAGSSVTAASGTFTVPATAAFVYLSSSALANLSTFMVVNGTVPATNYSAFGAFSTNAQIAADKTAAVGVTQQITSRLSVSPNRLNLATFTSGYFVNYLTGALAAGGTYTASDFIAVSPGGSTTVGGLVANAGSNGYAFYDSTFTYISGGQFISVTGATLTNPSNAAFIRISYLAVTPATVMVVNGTTLPAYYVPFSGSALVSNLRGLKFGTIGDSLCVGTGGTVRWHAVVTARNGLQEAYMGCRGGLMFSSAFECYGATVPGTAVTGTYDPTIMAGTGGGGHNCGFYGSVGQVTGQTLAQNLAAIDVMVIALGTNDSGENGFPPIGTLGDATNAQTLYGNMRWVIETVLAAKPSMRVIMVTNQQALIGTTSQQQLVAAAEVAFAQSYSIPVLDMMHTGGVNALTAATLLSDGTHPTTLGYTTFYGPRIAQFIQAMF